jgi:hypothetical protein
MICGVPAHSVKIKEKSEIYLSCGQPIQLKKKSGIYLSYGVPAHAVKGKARNKPELWHSSPCS